MEHFRSLAESLPHLVWTCEPDGCCDYLSPQWIDYTGKPESEQLGYGWLEQIHPEDSAPTKARWAATAASGEPFDAEFRIRRHDGVFRWFKARAVAIRDIAGTVVKWYGSNTDIQELRDAREAATRANQLLEARVAGRTRELDDASLRLRKLTLQLLAAQRIAKVGSWELEVATGSVTWSDELFHTFGMTPTHAPPNYETQASLFEAESWRRLQAAVAHSVATGEGYELDLVARRVDGTPVISVAHAEAVVGDSGKVDYLVGTFQDVTRRAERDRALEQVSERLRLATSAAGIGVWELDLASQTLVWDDAMYALYGRVPGGGTLSLADWQSAVHPVDLAALEEMISVASASGASLDATFRIATPAGQERQLRVAATFQRGAGGEPRSLLGVNWDITEQVEAARALRESEALQRAVSEHAGSAIIATTVDGVVTLFNHAAETLLGYDATEVVGKMTPGTFHLATEVEARRRVLTRELDESLETPFEAFVAKARRSGSDVNEWTYVRKDGRHVPVLLAVTVLRNSENAITGYIGIAVDLSQQKAHENELLVLNNQLSERKGQMEVLLQEIHHRVKNNLQIIASLVNMQGRQAADATTRNALAECRTRILTIALIHEQLYQSKDYARIPFYEYVERLVRNVAAASSPGQLVRVELELDKVTLPVETAIPCGLILNELITNSFKHGFPNGKSGTVTVRLKRHPSPDEVHLEVLDDGVGLSPSFDVERQRSLGMNLVRDLTVQLEGTLEVKTGAGAHFTIRLRG